MLLAVWVADGEKEVLQEFYSEYKRAEKGIFIVIGRDYEQHCVWGSVKGIVFGGWNLRCFPPF